MIENNYQAIEEIALDETTKMNIFWKKMDFFWRRHFKSSLSFLKIGYSYLTKFTAMLKLSYLVREGNNFGVWILKLS